MADASRIPGVPPPIVVTGMHRCGTTLLVRLLAGLGGHFGARTDPNAEDYFFMRLDEWVMRRAGGAWDWPLPTPAFLRHPRFFDDAAGLLARAVAGPRFREFTGGRPLAGPWGFKDPRAVFTFPLWARVFPGAKLLVIRRNGVDAAHSLASREAARWRDRPAGDDYLRIRPLMGRWQDALKSTESFENYLFSTRCLALADAFALWEEYVAEAEALLARAVAGPRFAEFTGGRSLGPGAGPWGFKDPRAVFTFPLWSHVFPGAKLLVIRRNGVDAAHSLATREAARWAGGPGDDTYLHIRPLMGRWQDVLKSTESFENYLFSTRCLTLEDAFALWEEYVAEAESLLERYDGPKLAVRYEDLVAAPEEQLGRIAHFCGWTAASHRVREVGCEVDRSRAFAFLGNEPLLRFYDAVRGSRWMQALGYGQIPGSGGAR